MNMNGNHKVLAVERTLPGEYLALDGLMNDFSMQQRGLLAMAMDDAIDKTMKRQSDMLATMKGKVQDRHRQIVMELRDEIVRQQPSFMDTVITKTLDIDANPGILCWIHDPASKEQAFECIMKLQGHLEARQGNAFRSDFEALLVVYMEYLRIPMTRGSRLNNRIEDFQDALQEQASWNDDLYNLVARVKWACYGVRNIGNARSHDSTPLSESEILQLCGCFSALGVAMPTLALQFDAAKPVASPPPPPGFRFSDEADTTSTAPSSVGSSGEFSTLDQLRHLAASTSGEQLGRILQLLTGGNATFAPAVSSNTTNEPRINTGISSWAAQPTQRESSSSPPHRVISPHGPVAPIAPLPPRASAPPGFAMQQRAVPTQVALAAVPSFGFYYDRPTEIAKETDRMRLAMFGRMKNHMALVPKARLCPFAEGHDASCPLSHSYLEVMSYNPLFKRLICRQRSHYWCSQVEESETCVCVHVDTKLTWEWLDESRDKRMYCPRGAQCTNNKCFKSHSFEEMCWYNSSYKIKKCAIRAHDYIAQGRGTIEPPLDCSYYHIESGKNADKRTILAEDDHVGKPVKVLFVDRTHKPLADALEALRYARAHNL